jgi:NMD protein affecting ribosome stability and mRNA decay
MTEHERDFILSLIENESAKSIKLDHLAYISKFTMKKGKITFFIGSEKFARSLASSFSYNLGGLIKETYKFGSLKIPKEVKQNKLYISVYLPTFIKGDLLWVKNTPMYVIKVQGKKVTCLNLIKYEKANLSLKLLKKVEILRYSNQILSFLYFSQTKDTIQLMDLKTYQIYEVSNSPKYSELEVGQYINGFDVKGQIYLIPYFN